MTNLEKMCVIKINILFGYRLNIGIRLGNDSHPLHPHASGLQPPFCCTVWASFRLNGSSTPKEQILVEIFMRSRANFCCINILYRVVSLEVVYTKSESSPRTRREKNHSQNVARARANSFSCQLFFVDSSFCHVWESFVALIIATNCKSTRQSA